jgi:hypothetical protein
MGRPHYVVLEKPDATIGKFRMKQWLRDNPNEIPAGMDASDNTAYQLRRGLTKKGWRLETLADEVHVIKPNKKGDTSYADELLPASPEQDEELVEEEEAEEVTFGLERDLQLALRSSIEQLESGLKITDGGKERVVEAGRIDITAVDAQGNSVVIELKAGTASPNVVAQVLAYMGSIAEADKTPVRGIIVAGDFHKKVILASHAIHNLELKKYSFQFKFGAP